MKRTLIRGLLTGAMSTLVMTLSIVILQRATSRWKLPPQQISEAVADNAAGHHDLAEPMAFRYWMSLHMLYGAIAGAVYSLAVGVLKRRSCLGGLIYGLIVWTGSYAGYLPKLNLYPSPDRDQTTRAITMIIAHCVYGATLGCLDQRLNRSEKPLE